jgi:ABC-type transport system involved in cytochrome c biogenesis permease subunit
MTNYYFTMIGLFVVGGGALGVNVIKSNRPLAISGVVLILIGLAIGIILPTMSIEQNSMLAIAYGIFSIAAIAFAANSLLQKSKLKIAAIAIAVTAFVLLTATILLAWFNLGRPPFQSLGETMIILAWCLTLVYLIFELVEKIEFTGLFAMICAILSLGFNYVYPDYSTRNLPPALQSAWFVPHVLVYFLAYGTLILAILSSSGYILAHYRGSDLDRVFDKITYKLVRVGFPFLTFGLIFGSFWGQVAWGNYWGWDPKENWSAVTWVVYLMYLHLRYVKGWNKVRANVFIILGGAAVFITYLAVSYLPSAASSIHVYQ